VNVVDPEDGGRLTRMLPAWLYLGRRVQRVRCSHAACFNCPQHFREGARGMGRHKIARWLDDQGVPTWGVARRAADWHRSYPQKILINPVVIGTFVPHHKQAPRRQCKAFDPIPNYFPAVVDRETFDSIASESALQCQGTGMPIEKYDHYSAKCCAVRSVERQYRERSKASTSTSFAPE
jgi:hypothetical protein